MLAIAQSHANLYATVGVHPDYTDTPEPSVADLVAMAQTDKVVAIGETGLDYYRLEGDLEWQRERFRTHIRAAREAAKPLVIHTRAAAADTIAIMREERAGEAGGVMHCFTETWDVAQAALDLGFHISFSGIVTFKNAVELQDVARRVPLDRMLIETDSPYLAPVPVPRQAQPAGVGAPRRRGRRAPAWRSGRGHRGRHVRQFLSPVQDPPECRFAHALIVAGSSFGGSLPRSPPQSCACRRGSARRGFHDRRRQRSRRRR